MDNEVSENEIVGAITFFTFLPILFLAIYDFATFARLVNEVLP